MGEVVCVLGVAVFWHGFCSQVGPLLRVLTRYLECGRGCPGSH